MFAGYIVCPTIRILHNDENENKVEELSII